MSQPRARSTFTEFEFHSIGTPRNLARLFPVLFIFQRIPVMRARRASSLMADEGTRQKLPVISRNPFVPLTDPLPTNSSILSFSTRGTTKAVFERLSPGNPLCFSRSTSIANARIGSRSSCFDAGILSGFYDTRHVTVVRSLAIAFPISIRRLYNREDGIRVFRMQSRGASAVRQDIRKQPKQGR